MAQFPGSRQIILSELTKELIGPKPLGRPLDLSRTILFLKWEDSRGPWHDAATGEEILDEIKPLRRYGAGVLSPAGVTEEPIAGTPGLETESGELDESPLDEK